MMNYRRSSGRPKTWRTGSTSEKLAAHAAFVALAIGCGSTTRPAAYQSTGGAMGDADLSNSVNPTDTGGTGGPDETGGATVPSDISGTGGALGMGGAVGSTGGASALGGTVTDDTGGASALGGTVTNDTGGASALGGAVGTDTGGTPTAGGATGTAGTGGTAAGAAQDDALASAYCAHLKECDPWYFTLFYDDDAACIAAELGSLDRVSGIPDFGQTPDSPRACLTALAQASCDTVFLDLPVPECASVPGKRTTGASCYSNGQCANLNCVTTSSSATCGTCKAGKTRGGSCTQTADCEGGLRCVNYACGDLGLVGASCGTSNDCVGQLMCVSGKCAAPLAVGQACTSTAACGLEASCLAGICQQDPQVALGASCGARSDGSYAQCAGEGICSGGRCVTPPSVGQSCSTSGPSCTELGRCTAGVCAAFDPTLCSGTASPDGGTNTSPSSSTSCSCVCICYSCIAFATRTCTGSSSSCSSCQPVCQTACSICSGLSDYSGSCS